MSKEKSLDLGFAQPVVRTPDRVAKQTKPQPRVDGVRIEQEIDFLIA